MNQRSTFIITSSHNPEQSLETLKTEKDLKYELFLLPNSTYACVVHMGNPVHRRFFDINKDAKGTRMLSTLLPTYTVIATNKHRAFLRSLIASTPLN